MILTQPTSSKRTVGGDFIQPRQRANAKPIEVAIEMLLAFNALTIVGSDGGVGKSVLLYRIYRAHGYLVGRLPDHFRPSRATCWIIQKDESHC